MHVTPKFRHAASLAATAIAATFLCYAALAATATRPAAPAPAQPAASAASASTPAPALPGLTAKDTNPNGCVSCHRGDTSLDKLLKKLKHKNVDKKTTTVPDDCGSCHGKDEDVDPLSEVVHLAHYGEGAKSEFVSQQGGYCLHCHSLDAATGKVAMKKGAKNW